MGRAATKVRVQRWPSIYETMRPFVVIPPHKTVPSWTHASRCACSWSRFPAPQAVLFTSDIHIDFPANWEWLEKVPAVPDSCLIVAGDVCTSLEKLERALRLLAARFGRVFYCPGNHELWTNRAQRRPLVTLVLRLSSRSIWIAILVRSSFLRAVGLCPQGKIRSTPSPSSLPF